VTSQFTGKRAIIIKKNIRPIIRDFAWQNDGLNGIQRENYRTL
jgi:hypothetical protein